ncbi:MAG: polysaccharide biosynthesis protein [Solirubrobacteraceae bacterium]
MRRRIRSAAFPVHRHSLPQLVVDGLLVAFAYFLAFRLRFDGAVPVKYEELFEATVWWLVPISVAALAAFGQYQRLWTYVGQRDYEAVLKAVVLITLITVGVVTLVHPIQTPGTLRIDSDTFRYIPSTTINLPAGVISLFFLLALALLVGARFVVHLVVEGRVRSFRVAKGARDVLIVGGGDGGRLVARELVRNPQLRLRPVGFVDDDPRKRGTKDEHGLKVLSTTKAQELARILDEVEPDEVVIAIPSAPGTLRARVVTACRARGIPVRTMPTVFELLRDGSGQVRVTRQLREVRVEDMLGREPVRMELERVGAYLASQVVLVSGAGGSIGSELARQIARVGPRKLVLVDHAEDNLFDIARELEEERHVRTAVPVLADCKEEERMREVFSEHRPSVVFHAAAYKHVAMMERNPVEAIRNNALATRLVARIAGEWGVDTFVLVSTDKAVKPATVMGASKALAEWAVEAAAARYPATKYAAVRFGNVLGSSGSVVPIFRRQIAAGGPVTVTDERMRRYFMTIPEAVQLIIRAGSLTEPVPLGSRGVGAVFVLDMGEPVRIVELAETMIRLSGLEPERDIAIEIVGARPGEKFSEDLFNPYERIQPTPAQKIVRAESEPLDPAWVEDSFSQINLLVLEGDAAVLAEHVSRLAGARSAPVGDSGARMPT